MGPDLGFAVRGGSVDRGARHARRGRQGVHPADAVEDPAFREAAPRIHVDGQDVVGVGPPVAGQLAVAIAVGGIPLHPGGLKASLIAVAEVAAVSQDVAAARLLPRLQHGLRVVGRVVLHDHGCPLAEPGADLLEPGYRHRKDVSDVSGHADDDYLRLLGEILAEGRHRVVLLGKLWVDRQHDFRRELVEVDRHIFHAIATPWPSSISYRLPQSGWSSMNT